MNQQNKVLAVVGGHAITEEDIQMTLMNLGQRAQQYNSPQGRKALLEQIVNKELMLQDARKNLMEHDAEFKKELEAVKKDLLANFYIEKFLRDVKVPESELQKYYDENPDQFQGNETVSASHILVDKEETALELLEKIQNGEISFEDAAKTSSTCPSGQKGGDLGEFGHGMMVKEFDEACFAMEPGELRGPIKTQFGYHLIRLDKKNPPRTISFSEAKDEIYRMLLSQAQQKAYQSKINQLRILYPVDYSSAL